MVMRWKLPVLFLLYVTIVYGEDTDINDSAHIVASKFTLSQYAVEGMDYVIDYRLYNVGDRAALRVALDDRDGFPTQAFDVIRGLLQVRWERISPGSNVSHSVVVRPRAVGAFNYSSAQITYYPNEDAKEVRISYTTAPGEGYIYRRKDYDRKFSAKVGVWLVFLMLVAPSTIIPFVLWYKIIVEIVCAISQDCEGFRFSNNRTCHKIPLTSDVWLHALLCGLFHLVDVLCCSSKFSVQRRRMIFLKFNLCVIIYGAVLHAAGTAMKDLHDLKYFDHRKVDFETFLMPSDFAMASELSDDDWQDSDDWALYSSGKFEGDMDIDVIELANSYPNVGSDDTNPQSDVLYNAVRNLHQLWPSSRIPYAMSNQYSPYSRSVIAAAMEEYALRTCIRWVPRSIEDYDYIYIVPDRGCYSMVGKTGGKQTVSLGAGCIQKGIIMHELMHAIGFFHEQSRTDRDNHITVLWGNIQPGMQGQFEKYDHGMIDSLGADYDYDSIMHYGPRAFSRNGQPTLVPKIPIAIGQRLHFSILDIFKINKLYNCSLLPEVTGIPAASSLPKINGNQKSTNPSTHLVITDSCRNIRSDCDELVIYEWCISNPRWMKHYCSKSCRMCNNSTVQPCVDQRPDCFTLVQNGHCTISNAFMQIFCSKSCDFCKSIAVLSNETVTTTLSTINTTATIMKTKTRRLNRLKQSFGTAWRELINSRINSTAVPSKQKICNDRKRFCSHWKSVGFCKGLFSTFMMENCQRSCQICTNENDDKISE
ncbi:Zinc metalloproteinase nas-15 [Dirofilaria immitis]